MTARQLGQTVIHLVPRRRVNRPVAAEPELRVPYRFVRLVYGSVLCLNLAVIFVTFLSDIMTELPPGLGQFDLKLEGNFAVWYSSSLLLVAGAAAALIATTPRCAGCRPFVHASVWGTVAIFCFGLSLDESIELHERIGRWFTDTYGAVPGLTDSGYRVFAWVLALAPLIALFTGVMIFAIQRSLLRERRSRTLATTALGCWLGAVGMEVAEAQLMRFEWERSIQGVAEEGLEITGTALFVVAFCEYLRSAAARTEGVPGSRFQVPGSRSGFEVRTPNVELRTPNPEPRILNAEPEPGTGNQEFGT